MDPGAKAAEVLGLEGEGYRSLSRAREEGVVASRLLGGFAFEVGPLFAWPR